MSNTIEKLNEKLKTVEDIEIIKGKSDLKRLSRDFYNYSPILKNRLDECVADIVVRPQKLDSIISIAKICWDLSVPLTIRGGGTGNYGQCVPLKRGVVLQLNYLNKVEQVDIGTGFVKVQSGCLMGDLNRELEKYGRELRLLPSTWRTATIGGFIAGGSGGIGSIKWGFLRDPGNLIGLEAVTLNENPKLLKFDASESEPLNHAYGTNGIITSLVLSTDVKTDWYSLMIDCENFEEAIQILKICTSAAIDLKLGAILEKDIVRQMPACFKLDKNCHKVLIQSSLAGIETIKFICKKYNYQLVNLGKESELDNGISDLVWNHTTLQMRAKDKKWTYLQMLLPQDKEIEFIKSLKDQLENRLLWHLEAVSQQGIPRLAALPVFKWINEDDLNQIIIKCKELGALIFNPHSLTVEGGGLGVIDANQVKAKLEFDPKGLLNPGKLEGWEQKDNLVSNI